MHIINECKRAPKKRNFLVEVSKKFPKTSLLTFVTLKNLQAAQSFFGHNTVFKAFWKHSVNQFGQPVKQGRYNFFFEVAPDKILVISAPDFTDVNLQRNWPSTWVNVTEWCNLVWNSPLLIGLLTHRFFNLPQERQVFFAFPGGRSASYAGKFKYQACLVRQLVFEFKNVVSLISVMKLTLYFYFQNRCSAKNKA